MELYHIALVAIVQGLTEFLPVSSSGHLILLPSLTGLSDQGLVIDVAVHVGTLGAVIVYFRHDVARALRGVPGLVRGRIASAESRLAMALVVATIPVVVLGLIFKITGLEEAMRTPEVIAWTMLAFGLVLWWADRTGAQTRLTEDWSLRHAWILGLWQAVALIPGTSRSGICITGARLLGYRRTDAARIAMLMSIPTIMASGALLGAEVIATADMAAARDGAIAALLAFLAALAALGLMMRLLRVTSFLPFVVYRVGLGVFLIWWTATA